MARSRSACISVCGERREALGDLQVLLEDIHVAEAGDGRRDGQRHGVVQHLLRGEDALLDRLAVAADGLHAEHRDAALVEHGKDLLLEAELVEVGIEGVQRHLHGVEGEAGVEHGEMDLGVLVAGESDEADLALLLGFQQRFGGAAGADEEVGIVGETDAVDLPEVDVVGLQPAQALFEHLRGERGVAAVGADLGHQEGLVAPALEALAQPVFGLAPAVLPAAVIEGDAAVESRVDKLDRGLLILRPPR